MANPTRLNISPVLTSRDGTSSTKDCRFNNFIAEKYGEELHFIKRPGYIIGDNAGTNGALGATLLPDGTVISLYGVSTGTNNATINISLIGLDYTSLNGNDKFATVVLSNNDLTATFPADAGFKKVVKSVNYASTFKRYCEFTFTSYGVTNPDSAIIGLVDSGQPLNQNVGYNATSYGYVQQGNSITNNSRSAYAPAWSTYSAVGIGWDTIAGTITFYGNGVSLGTAFTGVTGSLTPAISAYQDAAVININYGNTAFLYPAPAGYVGWAF